MSSTDHKPLQQHGINAIKEYIPHPIQCEEQ